MSGGAAAAAAPIARVVTPPALAAGTVLGGSLLAHVAVERGPVFLAGLVAGAVGFLLVARYPLMAVGVVLLSPSHGLSPTGPLGIQPVHVITVVAIGSVAFRALRVARVLPVIRPTVLWAVALVAAAFAATAFSPFPLTALRVDANVLVGFLLAMAVVAVARTYEDLRTLARFAVLGALLVTIPSLAHLGGLESRFGGALVEGRLQGPFSQPNELGTYSMVTVLVAVALLLSAEGWKDRALGAAGMLGSLGTLVFSLSRGCWAGLAVGLVVLVVLHPPVWRKLALAALTCLVAGSALVAVGPGADLTAVVASRATSVVNVAGNPEDRRDLVWQESLRLIRQSPVFGYGPGSFPRVAAGSDSLIKSYGRLHAHNVVLQVGVEGGALAVVALFGLGVSTARTSLSATGTARRLGRHRAAGMVAGLGAACCALVGQGLVDVTFNNPLIMVVIWATLGLLLAAASRVHDMEAGTRTRSFRAASPSGAPPW